VSIDRFRIRLLDEPGSLPIHLQIRYALEYAIGSSQLEPGSRLPSVRQLAVELQVAADTVARAYSDLAENGLVRTEPGRGTFVSDLGASEHPQTISRLSLRRILHPAIQSARAVGFKDTDIAEAIDEAVRQESLFVGLVGINQRIVAKWSGILEHELSDIGVAVIGLTLAELAEDPTASISRLSSARRVFSLVGTIAEARPLLEAWGKKVSALLDELSAETHQALARLPDSGVIGLVCRDFYVNSLLQVMSAYVNPGRVHRVLPDDSVGICNLCEEAEVVVHTLASAESVACHARPDTRLLELEYVPNKANLEQISLMLAKDRESLLRDES
jgi:GntR family transcriptional regulator